MAFGRPARLRTQLGLLTILTVATIFLHYTQLLRPVENLLTQAIQPAQAILFGVAQSANAAVSEIAAEEHSPEQLREENTALRDQVKNLQVENAHLKTLSEESNLLQEQVQFLRDRSYQAVTARITSRSTDQLAQSVIINQGSSDGVEVGDPVIVENGVLVGSVAQVSDHSAEVLLLQSFNSRVAAMVQNETRSPGVVQGEHSISLRMDYIPQLDTITVGQMVVTSGQDAAVPSGLLIGAVSEVQQAPGSLFQAATINPLFDSTKLTIVSVITL